MADQPSPSWIPQKFKAFSAIVAAEAQLFSKLMDLLGRWATKLRSAVFGSSHVAIGGPRPSIIDPYGVKATTSWFDAAVDDVVVEVHEVFDLAMHEVADDAGPDGAYRARQAAQAARNRLVNVPDTVFRSVQQQTMKATTEGWSIDELAAAVDDVLAEAGAERWRNRARTIARTEAVAAYNGGTYAGFLSYAKAVPGPWEKIWLETHDRRTRETHREHTGFGGMRVPLLEDFVANGVSMPYPGWPGGPAHEVVNCRCSILLAHKGEIIDFSNRHYRGNA